MACRFGLFVPHANLEPRSKKPGRLREFRGSRVVLCNISDDAVARLQQMPSLNYLNRRTTLTENCTDTQWLIRSKIDGGWMN